MNNIRLALASLLLLALAPGCATTGSLPSPQSVAQTSRIDEQAALAVTLAYTAAARAALVSIEAGIVTDRATIARIGELNERAHAAVRAVDHAYRAGNAASLALALSEARAAVALFLSSIDGASR